MRPPRKNEHPLYKRLYKDYIKKRRLKTKRKKKLAKRKKAKQIKRLKDNLRSRIRGFLKNSLLNKTKGFHKVLGCTGPELIRHFESQFQPGMTWKTYGRLGWNIDHRIPLVAAKTDEEFKKLCHYTNLQPMWATENRKKWGKYEKTDNI